MSTGSFEIRFWDIKRIGDTTKGRWRVRWAVAGREHCKSFRLKDPADAFLTGLKTKALERVPFDTITGLPIEPRSDHETEPQDTWYEHASAYAAMKWPTIAAKTRRLVAEALATVTAALVTTRRGAPNPDLLYQALFGYAFNPSVHKPETPDEQQDWPGDVKTALRWVARVSVRVIDLDQPDTVRAGLNARARTRRGQPAAASTVWRKRATICRESDGGYRRSVFDQRKRNVATGIDPDAHSSSRTFVPYAYPSA